MTEGLESLRAELAGELEPDFEIVRPLGSGAASHVFLAREPALRRLVALKVLRPEIGDSEKARARFEREANCEASVSHPSVPSVYRVGRLGNGLPYLAQEYVDGRSLSARLEATGAVTPPEARRILAGLAGALAAAHAKGVIHRDVRPGNVLIERETGRPFLVDFGIAAVRETGDADHVRLTSTGEILGDPQYSSPEVLRGEAVTAETDVYSLGVLGYELLTGTNPFEAASVEALIKGHLSGDPVELPWAVTGGDSGIGEILRGCLRKDPALRPRAEELGRILSGEGEPTAGAGTSGGLGALGGGARAAGRGPEDTLLAPFPRLAGFVRELRRRHVYQVAAVYAVVAFAVLQGAEVILPGLTAPRWVLTGLVLAALIGFPVVVVLAWIFEMTGGAIRRTAASDDVEESGPTRLYLIVGIVLAVVLAGVAGWLLLR